MNGRWVDKLWIHWIQDHTHPVSELLLFIILYIFEKSTMTLPRWQQTPVQIFTGLHTVSPVFRRLV